MFILQGNDLDFWLSNDASKETENKPAEKAEVKVKVNNVEVSSEEEDSVKEVSVIIL